MTFILQHRSNLQQDWKPLEEYDTKQEAEQERDEIAEKNPHMGYRIVEHELHDGVELDPINQELLELVQEHEPTWKRHIYQEQQETLSLSEQTVGYRIDHLVEDELLTTCLTKVGDGENTDFRIAYKTTRHAQFYLQGGAE